MKKTKHKCPLCKSPLAKVKFDRVTGIWKLKNVEIAKARREERKKVTEQNKKREVKTKEKNDKITADLYKRIELDNEKIKKLKMALENKNEIHLGFEAEKRLEDKLKEFFPEDTIDKYGKIGDILHTIKRNKETIGTIIYERKRTKTHSSAHIAQTRKAMVKRNADYGILVTTADKSKKFKGFSVEKGRVYVVRPAAVIIFATLLRNQLLEINKRKIPKSKRHQAADRALRFLKSKDFEIPLKEVLENLENNKIALQKEVRDHARYWNNRIKNYQSNSKYIEFVIQNSIKSIKGESLLKDPLSLKAKEVILLPHFKKKKVV